MANRHAVLTGVWGALIVLFGWNLGKFASGIHRSLTTAGPMSPTGGVVGILAWRPDLWFHPMSEPPFFTTTYPPTFPAIVGGLWRFVGGDLFAVGRAVTAVAILSTAALIGLFVYRWTDDWRASAVAGGLYLFSPLVAPPAVHMRVDYLAVAFGIAALYLFDRRETPGHLAAAVVLAVAAALTKQSMLAPGIAIVGVLALRRELPRATGVGAAYALGGLGVLGLMGLFTDGRAWTHLVANSAAFPWHVERAISQTLAFGRIHAILLPVAVAGGLLMALRERRWLIPLYTVAAIELAIFTVGRQGAWAGYFVPALAGACILAGWLLARSDGWGQVAVATLLVFQLGVHATTGVPMMYDPAAKAATINTIESVDNPVLAETPGLLYTAGHREEPYEATMMKFLGEEDRWDETPLLDRIRSHEYHLIVTRTNVSDRGAWSESKWSPPVLSAIDDHYQLRERNGGWYVYEPARS